MNWRGLALLIVLALAGPRTSAAEEPPLLRPIGHTEPAPQLLTPSEPAPSPPAAASMACPNCKGMPGACACGQMVGTPVGGEPKSPYKHWLVDQLMLRHSGSHGRAMGPGTPLRGTSWLNRPFSYGLDVGALFVASDPAENVRSNNDVLLSWSVGWDWDHYWGSQFKVTWSSPDFINSLQPTLPPSDNLFIGEMSLLYYPWGDSRLRPYYRVGIGLTDIEYAQDDGTNRQDTLLTTPFGVGVKYQMHRWVVWRTELVDNLAFGQDGTNTMNNFTLSTGIEWRFGGRRYDSWGWANRHRGW